MKNSFRSRGIARKNIPQVNSLSTPSKTDLLKFQFSAAAVTALTTAQLLTPFSTPVEFPVQSSEYGGFQSAQNVAVMSVELDLEPSLKSVKHPVQYPHQPPPHQQPVHQQPAYPQPVYHQPPPHQQPVYPHAAYPHPPAYPQQQSYQQQAAPQPPSEHNVEVVLNQAPPHFQQAPPPIGIDVAPRQQPPYLQVNHSFTVQQPPPPPPPPPQHGINTEIKVNVLPHPPPPPPRHVYVVNIEQPQPPPQQFGNSVFVNSVSVNAVPMMNNNGCMMRNNGCMMQNNGCRGQTTHIGLSRDSLNNWANGGRSKRGWHSLEADYDRRSYRPSGRVRGYPPRRRHSAPSYSSSGSYSASGSSGYSSGSSSSSSSSSSGSSSSGSSSSSSSGSYS